MPDLIVPETSKEQFLRFKKYFDALIRDVYNKSRAKMDFDTWLKTANIDFKEKQIAYVTAYNVSFGKKSEINIYDKRVSHFITYGTHKYGKD